MKIVIENTTQDVIYIGQELELRVDGLYGKDFRASNINTSNATLVDVPQVPMFSKGRNYKYINGEFVMNEQAKDDFNTYYKSNARTAIREKKDIEDDVTDTKIIVQWLTYAVVDIYNTLTQEQKDSMAYGSNIAMFGSMLQDPNANLRVDVEPDQLSKIYKIFTDELEFAHIAKMNI